MNFTFLKFDSLESTNTEALNQARRGAPEGLCVMARQQTAGRGRQGRAWISEKDAGLYFSIVLWPQLEPRFLPLITLMAGIAVHDTLVEYGLKPDIKWVNDVHINGRKISGILAETADTDGGLAVIVGIGINLNNANFPSELAGTATSVEGEIGRKISAEEIAGTLTRFIQYFYGILNGPGGTAAIVDEWRKRSTYYSGKSVRVKLGNETVTGMTEGLEPNGALRLRTENGRVRIIQAGDVEQIRKIID